MGVTEYQPYSAQLTLLQDWEEEKEAFIENGARWL
jgi:hypothetical protein